MTSTSVPAHIRELAEARRAARSARDWTTADRLRAEIEAAGWKVIDAGTTFRLEPAQPPDVEEAGRTRYGSSASVPSRLAEPATTDLTVVLLATDWPGDLERTIQSLRAHAPPETQTVIVANDPSADQSAALVREEQALTDRVDGSKPEVLWTSVRLGHAAALNAGTRRATGRVIALLDTSVEIMGDLFHPLLEILDDEAVAVTGPWGLVSADLRRFEESDAQEVVAIELYCQAFRRADYIGRGPLDEHFRFYRNLDIWWSLTLRDESPDRPARRAVRLDLPAVRHEQREYARLDPEEVARLSKRNFYRILDRFGRRPDLLLPRTLPPAE